MRRTGHSSTARRAAGRGLQNAPFGDVHRGWKRVQRETTLSGCKRFCKFEGERQTWFHFEGLWSSMLGTSGTPPTSRSLALCSSVVHSHISNVDAPLRSRRFHLGNSPTFEFGVQDNMTTSFVEQSFLQAWPLRLQLRRCRTTQVKHLASLVSLPSVWSMVRSRWRKE